MDNYMIKDNDTPYDGVRECKKCGCPLNKDEYYFCDNCSDMEVEAVC